MINILGENAWNLDQNSFNDDNFKFVTESDNYKLEEGIVFKVILKVKETIEVPNEVIFKLVDIEGSNGDVDIFTDDSELSINIIEKEKAPVPTITYSTTELTNQDVVATITFDKENVTVEGGNTHTFTENGEYTFTYRDQAGNEGTAKATVTWIDKVLPVATISYNITSTTNQDVVATVTFDKENVTVEGGNTHTFTENGEYTFTYRDQAGNEGTAKAAVTWIEKEQPEEPTITSNIYTIKDSYISRIEEETTVAEFKQKVEANMEITIVDNKGNKVEDDAIICTGMIVKIGEKLEYTAVVIGDINGDGKISITDIAKIKLHIIEKEILTGAGYVAGDINDDARLSITDLAQIKLIFLELPVEQ